MRIVSADCFNNRFVIRGMGFRYDSEAAAGASGGSTGTCFAVSSDGLLLTAAHVVRGERSLKVRFANSAELPAAVADVSSAIDVALLRVRRSTGAYLSLSTKPELKLGQQVFTIGYPATNAGKTLCSRVPTRS